MSDSDKDKINDIMYSNNNDELEHEATKITCDVLCSLIASTNGGPCHENEDSEGCSTEEAACKLKQSKRSCPKQLQLPLFLSSKSEYYQDVIE